MALILNNAHFKEVLGSPTFKNYVLKRGKEVATLSYMKNESSPPKKKFVLLKIILKNGFNI